MKLSGESKLFLGIIGITVALIAGAMILLSKPQVTPTYEVSALIPKGAHTKGNTNALHTLVEFSDFQCPACKAFAPVVNDIVTTYGDRLLFAYRHYPLSQHAQAIDAAIAAEAAGNQNKFFEMSDLLFANQEKLTEGTIWTDLAIQLQLEMGDFEKDLKDPALRDRVMADQAYGQSLNLPGTPTFFLDGKQLNVTSVIDLKNAIDTALK